MIEDKHVNLLRDLYYAARYGGLQLHGPFGMHDVLSELQYTLVERFKASRHWTERTSRQDRLKSFADFLVSDFGLAESIVISEPSVEYTLSVVPVSVKACLFLEADHRLRTHLRNNEFPMHTCLVRATLQTLLEDELGEHTYHLPVTEQGTTCTCPIVLLPVLEKEAEINDRLAVLPGG